MAELGELESNKAEFAKRNIEIVAVSVDGQSDAQAVQDQFPSIKVVSDESMSLMNAFDVLHKGQGPGGADVAAPTTFLVNGEGQVKFVYRSSAVAERIAVSDLLAAADKALTAKGS